MPRLGRATLALGIVAVAVALSLAWYVYGAWPVPEGYSFPRHSIFGGPQALFVGSLEDAHGCIRTAGDRSYAVIWPPGYRLSLESGEPVIHGGARGIGMGEPIRMGGGYYEDDFPSPPPGARDFGDCSPPYFLSTGLAD